MTIGQNLGGNDPYPIGSIIMWSGEIGDIPHGWAFCDGQNGTPDLTNKFIRGVATGSTEPGATGGQHSFTLSESQLPSHNHGASTSSDGEHRHQLSKVYGGEGSPGYGETGPGSSGDSYSNTTGNHTHSGSVGNTGGSDSINNRPQYTEVAFIQKLDPSTL